MKKLKIIYLVLLSVGLLSTSRCEEVKRKRSAASAAQEVIDMLDRIENKIPDLQKELRIAEVKHRNEVSMAAAKSGGYLEDDSEDESDEDCTINLEEATQAMKNASEAQEKHSELSKRMQRIREKVDGLKKWLDEHDKPQRKITFSQ